MLKTAAITTSLICLFVGLAARAQERLTGKLLLNATALKPGANAVLAIQFDIAEGFHAQSHKPLDEFAEKFTVKFNKVEGVTLSEPEYPDGVVHEYKGLGKVSVYEGKTVIFVPVKVDPAAKKGSINIEATLSFQICDKESCYPPDTKKVTLKADVADEAAPANEAVFKNRKTAKSN